MFVFQKIWWAFFCCNTRFTGCEITVEHWAYPTNLAQRPIEKRFLLLNGRTMSVRNLFIVKLEESRENSIYLSIL